MEILMSLYEREVETQQSLCDLLEHVIRPIYQRSQQRCIPHNDRRAHSSEENATHMAKDDNLPKNNPIFIPKLTAVHLKALFGPSELFENIVSAHKKVVDVLASKLSPLAKQSDNLSSGKGSVPKMESNGSLLHNDPDILHFMTEQATYSLTFIKNIVPVWLLLMKSQGLNSGLSPMINGNHMDDPDDGFIIASTILPDTTSLWTTHQYNMKRYLEGTFGTSKKPLNKTVLATFFTESFAGGNKSRKSSILQEWKPFESLSLNQLLSVSEGYNPIDVEFGHSKSNFSDNTGDPLSLQGHQYQEVYSTGIREQNISPIVRVFLTLSKPIACAQRLMYASKCQAISTWEAQLCFTGLNSSHEGNTDLISTPRKRNQCNVRQGTKLVEYCEKVQQVIRGFSFAYLELLRYQVQAFLCMLNCNIPSFLFKGEMLQSSTNNLSQPQKRPFVSTDGYKGDVFKGIGSSSTVLPELLHFGEVGKIHGSSVKRIHKRSLFLFENFLCYTEVVEDKKATSLLSLQRHFIEEYCTKKRKEPKNNQQKKQHTNRRWSCETEDCLTEPVNNKKDGENTHIRRSARIRPENCTLDDSTKSITTKPASVKNNKTRTFRYFSCCTNGGQVLETCRRDRESLSSRPSVRSRHQVLSGSRNDANDDMGVYSRRGNVGSTSLQSIDNKLMSSNANHNVSTNEHEGNAYSEFLASLSPQDATMVQVLNTSLAAQSLATSLSAYSYAKVLYKASITDQMETKSNSRSSTLLPPLIRNIYSQTTLHRTISSYLPPILKHRIRAIFYLCPEQNFSCNHSNGSHSVTETSTVDTTDLVGTKETIIHSLLRIEDCVESEDSKKKDYCFELVVPSRRYSFFAPTADEKMRWLSAINAARMRSIPRTKVTHSKNKTNDSKDTSHIYNADMHEKAITSCTKPSNNKYSFIIAASKMHPFHDLLPHVMVMGKPSTSNVKSAEVLNDMREIPAAPKYQQSSTQLPPLRVALQLAFLASYYNNNHTEEVHKVSTTHNDTVEGCMNAAHHQNSAKSSTELSRLGSAEYFPRKRSLVTAYGYGTPFDVPPCDDNMTTLDANMATDNNSPTANIITSARDTSTVKLTIQHDYSNLSSLNGKEPYDGVTQSETVDSTPRNKWITDSSSTVLRQCDCESLDNYTDPLHGASCIDYCQNMTNDVVDINEITLYSVGNEQSLDQTNGLLYSPVGDTLDSNTVSVRPTDCYSGDTMTPLLALTPDNNNNNGVLVRKDSGTDTSASLCEHYLSNECVSCEEGDSPTGESEEAVSEPTSEHHIGQSCNTK